MDVTVSGQVGHVDGRPAVKGCLCEVLLLCPGEFIAASACVSS